MMNKEEKELKSAIIKTSQAIKRKYKDLHFHRIASENSSKEKYELITKPLNTFIHEYKKKKNVKNTDKILAEDTAHLESEMDGISNDSFDNRRFQSSTPITHSDKKLFQPRRINFDDVIGESENNDEDDLTSNGEHSSLLTDDSQESLSDEINSTNGSVSSNIPQYIKDYLKILGTNKHDYNFGIRNDRDVLKIGDTVVTLNANGLNTDGKTFPFTKGFFDLLFYRNPPNMYTNDDLNQYKEVLMQTNAHRTWNDPDGSLKRNRSNKYKNIIVPMFKNGKGLQSAYMAVENGRSSYVYWDNPNEIVDRLRLLVASVAAGHTGHNNEIISIIEELREADIIV